MAFAGHRGKVLLGVILVLAGIVILGGLDRRAEGALVRLTPAWLLALTTRF